MGERSVGAGSSPGIDRFSGDYEEFERFLERKSSILESILPDHKKELVEFFVTLLTAPLELQKKMVLFLACNNDSQHDRFQRRIALLDAVKCFVDTEHVSVKGVAESQAGESARESGVPLYAPMHVDPQPQQHDESQQLIDMSIPLEVMHLSPPPVHSTSHQSVPAAPPSSVQTQAPVPAELATVRKVNKDTLLCSHGNSLCIHYTSLRGCDLGVACKFCHQPHPVAEQTRLEQAAREEYARRRADTHARAQQQSQQQQQLSQQQSQQQSQQSQQSQQQHSNMNGGQQQQQQHRRTNDTSSPQQPLSRQSSLNPHGNGRDGRGEYHDPDLVKVTSVASFIDYLKQISFNIVFQFAVVLHSTQPNALRDSENDIRKYLFHISRHAAVITGVAKVPPEGVSAGILLFRIAAHLESVPESQFKTLVKQYMAFLENISIYQHDGSTMRFESGQKILAKLDQVFFPNGLTFPMPAKDVPAIAPAKLETVPEVIALGRGSPAINVRELHRRKLCVACRHFLRGMCYRGDGCNFCHDPSHAIELEKSNHAFGKWRDCGSRSYATDHRKLGSEQT